MQRKLPTDAGKYNMLENVKRELDKIFGKFS